MLLEILEERLRDVDVLNILNNLPTRVLNKST